MNVTNSNNNPALNLPQGFSIKKVNTGDEADPAFIREVGQLRYKVWSEENMDMSNSTTAGSLLDSIDDTATIWGIYHEGQMVGTARLNLFDDLKDSPTAYMHNDINSLCPGPVASLTRLVVLKGYRSLKLGKWLDAIRLQAAQNLGAKTAFMMCPPWRVEPLQRMGYQCLGKAAPSKLWPDAQWMIMKFDLSQ